MKRVTRFLASFLALAVLISSGGVVLAVHYCSSQSEKSISLFKEQSCCSGNSSECEGGGTDSSLKNNCCDLKFTYHKVNIASVVTEYHAIDFYFPLTGIFSELIVPIHAGIVSNLPSNKAPPFFTGGKTFLHISHRLLI